MKMIIAFAAVLALALAVPIDDSKHATILRYDNDNIGVEGYKFGFETSDGTAHDETGELKHFGPEEDAIVSRGYFKFVGDDGVTYTVNYIADENGFQPEGAHLPKE